MTTVALRLPLFLGLLTLAWPGASGFAQDPPEISLPFDAKDFEPGEPFGMGTAAVESYRPTDSGAAKEPGVSWFVVRRRPAEGAADRPSPYAYRARVSTLEKGSRIDLALVDLTSPAEDRPAELFRVASEQRPEASPAPSAVRSLLEKTDAVKDLWDQAKAPRASADPASKPDVHAEWEGRAEGLEEAHRRFPAHLGILRDLVVAYGSLLPMEKGTPRGENLSVLIPNRIAEFEMRGGSPTAGESLLFRRVLAFTYFHGGLYALADRTAREQAGDPELARLLTAISGLGIERFDALEEFEVPGRPVSIRVTVLEARGKPSDPKFLFPRYTFLTRPKDASDGWGPVAFTFSSQTLGSDARYYLYGHASGSQKVLALYGRTPPEYGEVKRDLVDRIRESLAPREPK
jgi:hypothetical protein